MEQKKTFEPFERVLVFNAVGSSYAKWACDMFSHISDGYFICLGGIYKIGDYDIIPFAGNETLVGTSDMPCKKVELKEGELVALFDDINNNIKDELDFHVGKYKRVCNLAIEDFNGIYWTYCIPFSKFNLNDMEETRKHILCVKNGKLVKLNGK